MLKTLLNFLLITLLFLSTIGYVGYQLVKPGFLVGQAEKVHLYDQATAQINTLIPKDALKNSPFSPTDLQTVITKAIDGPTFYGLATEITNAQLNYLTGRSASLNYQINLVPIKKKLVDQGTAVLVANYQALPICKASELKTWNATTSFPTCQLSSTNVQSNDVTTLLSNQVNQQVSNLPDKINSPTPNQSLISARARITQVLSLIKITWLTTIGIILLYILFLRRRAFLPLALIFLVAGGLEVAFSFVAWDWLKRLILDQLSHPDTSQQMITIIGTLVDDVVQTLKTILGNLSIITLSIGGLFIIIWAFTRFSRAKGQEKQLEIPRA